MPIDKPQIQLQDNLKTVLGTQISKPVTMRIGNPTTSEIFVNNTDKLGLIYGHQINPSYITTIVNDLRVTELIYGDLIKVRKEYDGFWHLVGFAPESGEYVDGVNVSNQVPVYRSQVIDGGLLPTDTGVVLYKGTTYTLNDTVYVTTDQNTGDLIDGTTTDTSAVAIQPPTNANKSIYVLVQIDVTTNTLSYKQSAEFPNTFTYNQAYTSGYLPNPDTSNAITGYVRLNTGLTLIKRENITSLADIYRIGGGSSGIAFTDESTTVDPTTLATFNGSQFVISDEGSGEAGIDIADDAIGGDQLQNDSVSTAKIQNLAVTNAKIANSTIDLTAKVTSALPIANGGTNATTATSARTNLDTEQTISGRSLTAVTVATDDKVLIQDTSDSDNLKTVTAQSIADLASGGGSLNYVETTTPTASYTTSSTTAVNVDAVNLTLSITTTGGVLFVGWMDAYFVGATQSATRSAQVGFDIGGTFYNGAFAETRAGGNFSRNSNFLVPVNGLVAATYTINLQYLVASNNLLLVTSNALFFAYEL